MFEKRCDDYTHSIQYKNKRSLKGSIYNKHEGKNPKYPKKITIWDEPLKFLTQGGLLSHQVPKVITFAYDLDLRCSVDNWNYLVEEYNNGSIIDKIYAYHMGCYKKIHKLIDISWAIVSPKHRSLGPQNKPRSSVTKKL